MGQEMESMADNLNEESDDVETITVDRAMESTGFGPFQTGVLFFTGLCWFSDSMEMILLSFVGPAAQCEWSLSGTEESLVTSSVFLGILIGSYSWGSFADIYGRRKAVLLTSTAALFFGVLSAWSPYFWSLLLFRTLVGFGIAGSSVMFSLCSEFLPPSKRGFWLVFVEFFWTIGAIAEAALAWAVLPSLNWRFLVLFSALPFLGMIILSPWLPESPQFLLRSNDYDGAVDVLKRVADANGTKLPAGKIILAEPQSAAGHGSAEDSQSVPRRSPLAGALQAFSRLVSKDLIQSSVVLWTVGFSVAFSYYGQVLLPTQLPAGEHISICTNSRLTAVAADSSLFGHSQETAPDTMDVSPLSSKCTVSGQLALPDSTYRAALLSSFAEFPGLLGTLAAVNFFGRRASLSALLLVSGLALLPLFGVQSDAATSSLLFVARASLTGCFAIVWAYSPDLFPTAVRAGGVGMTNVFMRLGGIAAPFIAVGLLATCQRIPSVGLFALVPVIASLLTLLLPREEIGEKET